MSQTMDNLVERLEALENDNESLRNISREGKNESPMISLEEVEEMEGLFMETIERLSKRVEDLESQENEAPRRADDKITNRRRTDNRKNGVRSTIPPRRKEKVASKYPMNHKIQETSDERMLRNSTNRNRRRRNEQNDIRIEGEMNGVRGIRNRRSLKSNRMTF